MCVGREVGFVCYSKLLNKSYKIQMPAKQYKILFVNYSILYTLVPARFYCYFHSYQLLGKSGDKANVEGQGDEEEEEKQALEDLMEVMIEKN